jgi:hypothetical protein
LPLLRPLPILALAYLGLLYAGVAGWAAGTDGRSISYATTLYATGGRDYAAVIRWLPGAGRIARWSLMRSMARSSDRGCQHLMLANNSFHPGISPRDRDRLLDLMQRYLARGADPDRGCDSLASPPLWMPVMEHDPERVRLLMDAGAAPERAWMRTARHPAGLDLAGLIAVIRANHPEDPATQGALDEIEALLWPESLTISP